MHVKLIVLILMFNFRWNVIYMGSNSNIVFLEKNCDKWIEKLSNIPQNWFLTIMKEPCFLINQNNFEIIQFENRILSYCREKEKILKIKSKEKFD